MATRVFGFGCIVELRLKGLIRLLPFVLLRFRFAVHDVHVADFILVLGSVIFVVLFVMIRLLPIRFLIPVAGVVEDLTVATVVGRIGAVFFAKVAK